MINYIESVNKIKNQTGWSQEQLAQEIGVTFSTVSRWLNRHTRPHPGQLRSIEKLYKRIIGIPPISSKEIVDILSHVNNKKKQYPDIRQLLKHKRIAEKFLLEMTYHSNAMEGSPLSKREVEAIIFDRMIIRDKNFARHLEPLNHSQIVKKIFSEKIKGKIGETLIKRMHAEIMYGILGDAGSYATQARAIKGVEITLPKPEFIPEEMRVFCRKVNRFESHPIMHIAKMHADFEMVHPFDDGNGRIGRLIMNIQLIENGFPPCVIHIKQKDKYYECLEYAQKRSVSHLICFIAEATLRGYGVIEKFR